MRILISQREVIVPPSFFTFDALERSWYNLLSNHKLIPIPNICRIDESIEYDCLVLTGGPDSIERHITEDLHFKYALNQNKPIIGVCHGAFAVNDLTGGKNGKVDGHWQTDHAIYMDGQEYLVNSYHEQSIASIGEEMVVVATDEEYNIEAFKHKDKPIFGIVWHPERMENPVLPMEVRQLLEM